MVATGEEIRYQSPDGRKYKVPAPAKTEGYIGVTSVINNTWPASHLEDWKIGNIARHCVMESASLSKRLKKISKRPPAMREFSKDSLKKTFVGWKEDWTAANRGTRIHSLLEAHYAPMKPPENVSADEADTALAAIAALDQLGFTAVAAESVVYNHTHQYAGTIDLVGTFEVTVGKKSRTVRAVVDLKTGRRISKSYAPQLAAYAYAEQFLDPAAYDLHDMPPIDQALILHATAKKAEFYRIDLAESWEIFLACLRIHKAATSGKSFTKL